MKRGKVVQRPRPCTCEAWPFCEHASNASPAPAQVAGPAAGPAQAQAAPGPRFSDYTPRELGEMHVKTFRGLVGLYPRGHCVGEGPYLVRVSNDAAWLVTRYRVKDAAGAWSGVNESKTRL